MQSKSNRHDYFDQGLCKKIINGLFQIDELGLDIVDGIDKIDKDDVFQFTPTEGALKIRLSQKW